MNAPETMLDQASPGAEFFTLALTAIELKNADSAYQYLVACLKADQQHAGAWFHLSDILFNSKKHDAALHAIRRAYQLHPGDPRVMTNLGWYSHVVGDNDTAMACLKRVVELAPELPLGWSNLSQVEITMGDLKEGLRHAQRGVDLGLGEPRFSMCLAFAHLYNGNLREGLEHYRARFPFKLPMLQNYPYPTWKGEHVGTLFIQAEQGIGDTISMLRFIPEAARRVDRVMFFTNRELFSLCQDWLPENVTVFPIPQHLPKADAWTAMMSLPLSLGLEHSDLERFSAPYISGYYNGDGYPEKPYKVNPALKRVAMCWSGSGANDLDYWRSMPLKDMMALTHLPNTTLHAVQVGPRAADITELGLHGIVEDMTPWISDMRDTVRILQGMDLTVTVDTSVAHLAGAMGIPAIVIRNRRAGDWRWSFGQNKFWYPKIHHIERQWNESWPDVMERAVRKAEQCLF